MKEYEPWNIVNSQKTISLQSYQVQKILWKDWIVKNKKSKKCPGLDIESGSLLWRGERLTKNSFWEFLMMFHGSYSLIFQACKNAGWSELANKIIANYVLWGLSGFYLNKYNVPMSRRRRSTFNPSSWIISTWLIFIYLFIQVFIEISKIDLVEKKKKRKLWNRWNLGRFDHAYKCFNHQCYLYELF